MQQKKIIFDSALKMPHAAISVADMSWNETGTWRYLKPRYESHVPPCSAGCPGGEDIEGWLRLMGKGEFIAAWRLLREENPFPGICGRVCFHPCERACNRAEFDRSVSINNLERFLADMARTERASVDLEKRPPSGKRVALVGSGPAGLSAAHYLTRLGHQATVFEEHQEPGGVLRIGIPEYRLPRDVLDHEIAQVLDLGVELRCGVRLGPDLSLGKLASDYDAVFIATGAHRSRKMKAAAEVGSGVMSGLAFLKAVSQAKGPPFESGARVLVIGGGNTALDAARTSRRFGARVTIVYRRSRAEMPAYEEEVLEAEREGIEFKILAAPKRVVRVKGKLTALECLHMKLGEPDDSGRRRPVPIEGSEFLLEADAVLSAVGEECDLGYLDGVEGGPATKWDSIVIGPDGGTTMARVYAGGDVVDQNRTVIDAIGSGKRAAIAIDCLLRGTDLAGELERCAIGESSLSFRRYLFPDSTSSPHGTPEGKELASFSQLNTDHFKSSPRGKQPKLALGERFSEGKASSRPFSEVDKTIALEVALKDAARCFHCGRCTDCDNCLIFCPDCAVRKREGGGYEIDFFYCKGCGVCVEECPRHAMAIDEELKAQAIEERARGEKSGSSQGQALSSDEKAQAPGGNE